MYLYIRMIIVLIVTLYTSRIILKTLGFEDFGIYNVVGSVVVFLSFLEQALTNATYRFLAYEIGTGNKEKLQRIYSMAINAHMLLALVLFVVMEIVGAWFVNNKLNIAPERLYAANWLFQFSLLIFCFGIIKTPFNSNIIAHEKMNFYAVISIIEVLLKLGAVYLLVISPIDKLITYVFFQFVVAGCVFVGYFIYCKIKLTDTKYIKYWSANILKEFISFSGWSLFVNGAVVTAQQSLSIFFNWFIGVIGNAALGIANQVSGSINMFVSNFTQAFNPQIIKSYAAQDYDKFNKLIFTTSKISYVLLLFIAVPAVANIDLVLKVWLGEYPDLAPAYIRAVILCYVFDSSQQPLMIAVHATGKIKIHQIIIGSIKLLSIPFMYYSLKMTANGTFALLIWAGQNLVCACARIIYTHYLIHLNLKNYFYHVVLPILLFTILTVPLPFYIVYQLDNGWYGLLLSGICSVVLTGVAGYFVILDKNERGILQSIPLIQKLTRKRN